MSGSYFFMALRQPFFRDAQLKSPASSVSFPLRLNDITLRSSLLARAVVPVKNSATIASVQNIILLLIIIWKS